MTKGNMIRYYRKFSAANEYIIGFTLNHKVYMVRTKEITPQYLRVEEASRNYGENLRFRVLKAQKEKLLDSAICLGTDSILNSTYWNKGEMFEKVVTEYFGQVWKKDTIPFTKHGDINVNGIEVQIKFENATLMNTTQMHRLQRASKVSL